MARLYMTPPWQKASEQFEIGCGLDLRGSDFSAEDQTTFIKIRSELHALYIRESERTRRLSMMLAAGLLALACLVPVFAPVGREAISYWMSVTLFIFAAGSMGYTSIKIASEKRQVSVTKGTQDA